MASNFNKAERYVKQGDEYKLLSYATSSESVKMTDGTDLQSKIDEIDDTLSDIDSTIDEKIADLVNSAPETLDTLGEIAQAIEENQEVVDALDSAITNKVDKEEGKGLFSGSYKDLTNTPTLVEGDNITITTNEDTNEITISSSGGSDLIVDTVEGVNPTINNSTDSKVIYLKNIGYTKQDGTPTPNNPIRIKGLGDNGTIEVRTCGKNLLETTNLEKVKSDSNHAYWNGNVMTYQGCTYTVNADGTITVNGTPSKIWNNHVICSLTLEKSKIYSFMDSYVYTADVGVPLKEIKHSDNNNGVYVYECLEDCTIYARCGIPSGQTYTNYILYPMVVEGDVNLVQADYEPYTETTATIPIDTLYDGDYIEVFADGSGKIVQENDTKVFNGSEYWVLNTEVIKGVNIYLLSKDVTGITYTPESAKSNLYPYDKYYHSSDLTKDRVFFIDLNNVIIRDNVFTSVTEFKTFLGSNNLHIVYKRKEPIETPLTAEQVAEFKKLQTFKGVTHINADGEVTVRYYCNNDSGDTVGMLQGMIPEIEAGENVVIEKDDNKITISSTASGGTTYIHPDSGVTAGTYRSVTVNKQGHVTAGSNPTVTVAQGGTGATDAETARTNLGITPANIGAATSGHTHTSYANQNAFSNVKVGSTTVAADTITDTLELVAGSNVTITPDATNDKITIAATDTKYTHPTYTSKSNGFYKVTVDATGHVSGTTAVAKSDIIALGIPAQDTTYSAFVKSGSGAKAGLVPAPPTTAGTAKYLREDATWATPPKVSVANNLTTTTTGMALDATQGKALDDKISTLNSNLATTKSNLVRNDILGFINTYHNGTGNMPLNGNINDYNEIQIITGTSINNNVVSGGKVIYRKDIFTKTSRIMGYNNEFLYDWEYSTSNYIWCTFGIVNNQIIISELRNTDNTRGFYVAIIGLY